MWIAQGMISDGQNGETLTDIAELYLSELASRCIVQVELEDVIPTQKYKTCKLHDVVRELCLSMGKKEDFVVQTLEYQEGNLSTLLEEAFSCLKTRHLTIHFKREVQLESDENTITFPEDSSRHLRSLEILGDIKWKIFEFPPQSIVDFRKFKLLRGLPLSITNLAYLDTLDLFQSQNVGVPNVLKNLRRFSASISDNESLSIIINAIATKWNKLSYCTVSIKQGCQLTTSKEGLMKLRQAFSCPNLCYLRIYVRLGKLLEECTREIISSKLVKLSMLECEIEDDPMGILAREASSPRRTIFRPKIIFREVMTCPGFSFPRLKKVVLNSLRSLRVWRVEQGVMPLLSEINMHRCPCLEKVPDGLSCILTLQKLVISRMPRLGKRVLASGRGGEDFHKVRHVPSIIIN